MFAELNKQLVRAASEPYRNTGRFNHGWARGKLGHDPVFAGIVDLGVIPNGARLVDLGCGRGLLAAWLLGAERLLLQGQWRGATQPPRGLMIRGVELMEREADCGNRALQPIYGERVRLSEGDMRCAELGRVDVITMLDVLHYIPFADQDRLLDRIRAALIQGGLLIARVGDAGAGWRFRFSKWVDAVMWYVQGHRLPSSWCRSVDDWVAALQLRGFTVETTSMSRGTPFANVLLVARVPVVCHEGAAR